MPVEFRPKAILETLRKRRVDFVVIGGSAAVAQGSVLPSFDLDIAYARSTEIDGEPVLVASLDHLIAMKEASGRQKDQYQAKEYRTLADEIRRRGN